MTIGTPILYLNNGQMTYFFFFFVFVFFFFVFFLFFLQMTYLQSLFNDIHAILP